VKLFLAAMFLFFSSALAESATQSDWSGGPGVSGPVSTWSSSFAEACGVIWQTPPGQIVMDLNGEHLVESESDAVTSVRPLDIDGDGDIDIVGASYYSLSWWENADGGGTTWTEHSIAAGTDLLMWPGDVNGDGHMDILTSSDNGIAWIENVDGSGASWVEHVISTSLVSPVEPRCSDFDGDGDSDVLCADFEFGDGAIYWWENLDGAGTSWEEHTIDAGPHGFNGVHSDDVDGDGDSDILAAAVYDSDIIWFDNVDGQGSSWLKITIDSNFDRFDHLVGEPGRIRYELGEALYRIRIQRYPGNRRSRPGRRC
jgi:hypothetical protein